MVFGAIGGCAHTFVAFGGKQHRFNIYSINLTWAEFTLNGFQLKTLLSVKMNCIEKCECDLFTQQFPPSPKWKTYWLIDFVSFAGRPRPNVTWYLDNTVIDESFEHREGVTRNHLTFPNIGRQHVNARFVCMASNTNLVPPNSKVLILDVNCKWNVMMSVVRTRKSVSSHAILS